MDYLNFEQANCQNCYKCIRTCPVKAIEMVDKQAKIIAELCVGCGECFAICPQNAKSVKTDIDAVKTLIKNNEKCVVSLAPSFPSFDHLDNPLRFIGALKALGFNHIEETSIGAVNVSNAYKLEFDSDQQHIITSSCPTVNFLITKYYPHLVKYLSPTISPMMAHNKIIKERNQDVYTIFIGPCISKKEETKVCTSKTSCIDYVITFNDIRNWLKEENIDVHTTSPSHFELSSPPHTRWYPLSGGVEKATIKNPTKRRIIKVDGMEECKDLLESLETLDEHTWVEMNACHEGCINGYGNSTSPLNIYQKIGNVKQYIEHAQPEKTYEEKNIDVHFDYTIFPEVTIKKYSEEDIKDVLLKLGKSTKEDELNCSGCGYDTCRDKARAILDGKATVEMCLPHMRMISEHMNNVIIENTPNAVIVTDEDYHIIGFNQKSVETFMYSKTQALHMPVDTIIEENVFETVDKTDQIKTMKKHFKKSNRIFNIMVKYIPNQKLYLGVFTDITSQEKNKIKQHKTRLDVLDMAQNVIDKQMIVAHEIASLLGETTAETKVTLSQLKDLFDEENA
jgi:iron only hydrogenase large subunit-like protein